MEKAKATYQERFIVFIDILGTKTIVDKTIENNFLLDKISCALLNIKKSLIQLLESYSLNDNIKLECFSTHFSDSFVLSIKIDEDQLFITSSALLFCIQTIIIEFLNLGILVRGGVTYGNLIHDENVLFGPAIVEAYELENKKAIYPRIIFSKKIVEFFQKKFDNRLPTTQSLLNIIEDDDYYYYFDYIDADFIIEPDRKIDYMVSIIECLKSNDRSTESLIAKYNWLRNKILNNYTRFNIDDFILSINIDSDRRVKYSEQEKKAIINFTNDYVKSIHHLKLS